MQIFVLKPVLGIPILFLLFYFIRPFLMFYCLFQANRGIIVMLMNSVAEPEPVGTGTFLVGAEAELV